MNLFFEILKLTLPSLVVFFTVYFMLKLLLEERQRMDSLMLRQDAQKITLPLRIQAYERLTLLCERTSIPNTLLRVRTPGMTVAQLTHALLISINQEFDHNTSQQLFVSDTLWRIITTARQQTLMLITQAAEGLDPQASDEALVQRLFAMLEAQGEPTPLQKAIVAIRTEAGQLF
ncbi:MAG: hypothetical protein NZM43_10610 [Saprospiraceae bacterium]|nr:hypothetical protein [Saprospiraceae bacterium]MDW8484761.1 hypothetical protein [Saprospiraceae bacterium]